MNTSFKEKQKKHLQNTAIVLLILIALKNLLAALPLKAIQSLEHFYVSVINPSDVVLHHALSFVLGLLMLILAYRLSKRVRLAWAIEVALIFTTIILQIIHYHRFTVPIILIELFVVMVLSMSYRDFSRETDPITVKKALGFVGVSFCLVLLNGTVGLFMLRGHITGVHDIIDAFISSFKLLIFLDTGIITTTGAYVKIYVFSLIVLNWICIVSAVILLLKPIIYHPIITKRDREKVRKLVLEFGQNPMSYLALENDKKYFFGTKCEGVCAYTIVNDVFVVCGDMICANREGFVFLNEVIDYCKKNAYQILFVNVTDYFYALYQAADFGLVKMGEDCCFELENYNLSGGKVAKVRAAINHATKAGIKVHEYRPAENKSEEIERQIADITEEWLKTKGGYEMQFTIGGTVLWEPLDRRYFYACDENGLILGFVVFLPYEDAYLADVTRRRNDAPQGVLEKIIYESFMQFKDEGIHWGNMGLSPLYNIADKDKSTFTEKLFAYIYENMNESYGFQKLHHAKEKYAPTHWIPRYLAFYPKPFSPRLALALVRCQNKTGISKIVLSEVFKKGDK